MAESDSQNLWRLWCQGVFAPFQFGGKARQSRVKRQYRETPWRAERP